MTGKAPSPFIESAAIHQDIAAVSRISAVPSILKVVSELTGMRFTLVARVTPENWTACAVHDRMEFGLEVGGQLDVATTLCKEVCDSKKPIIIEHASTDPIYSKHNTPKLYNIESYLAIPIFRPNGNVFGTLCAIDSNPAKLDPKVIASLTLFSELISRQLRAEEERQEVEQSLWDEREISQLREQFIAVLGHDLRTPLGAISASTSALIEESPKPGQVELLHGVQESCQQMSGLIEDVMDFARGRLGGGILVDKGTVRDVYELTHLTLNELSKIHRDRAIDFQHSKPILAVVDEVRFRQLLSNIVGNALQHSPADKPVIVKLDESAGMIRLAVKNAGKPLPQELQGNSFAPFVRRPDGKKSSGLGLGLYIASEIARAHGGSLHASSTEEGTTFTLLMPIGTNG